MAVRKDIDGHKKLEARRSFSAMRRFLIFAAPSALLFPPCFASANDHPILSKEEILEIKQRIVALINQQRRSHGLRPVELDEFASRVAESHCKDMLAGNYISHWNRDGIKPYIRYSDAGGIDAVMENVSALWGGVRFNLEFIYKTLEEMHLRMYNERPPNDGHRRNILQPQHTHVGIGIAYDAIGLRFAQEFVARYVEISSPMRSAKAGEKVLIKGRLLYDETDLAYMEVFYEPFPKPLTAALLNKTGSYEFPQESFAIRPILPSGYQYADGKKGEIEYDKSSGRFSYLLDIPSNRSGIYTVVVLVSHRKEKFPATNIAIRVE